MMLIQSTRPSASVLLPGLAHTGTTDYLGINTIMGVGPTVRLTRTLFYASYLRSAAILTDTVTADLTCMNTVIVYTCEIHWVVYRAPYIFFRDSTRNGRRGWYRKPDAPRALPCAYCDAEQLIAREDGQDWVRGSPTADRLYEFLDAQMDSMCAVGE